ncbi:Galactose-binding domain-like protein [Pseudohyphozyma bogoriensis]|nr:Galactose-binding domain-like protein [Pseudohyphozyma bogoriensis]
MLTPLALLALAGATQAHMSIWPRSMYGMFTTYPPSSPIGPNWDYDDWWFRGAPTRNSPPAEGEVTILPAGGNITLEISCNLAFTTDPDYGYATSDNVACPEGPGPYHSGDPDGPIDYNLLAGCALAIADVDDINLVTVDNLAVFSVQHECVWVRDTVFEIPAKMPPCTGKHCICAWLWEPQNGTGNYYQTPFNCDVSGSPADATPIQMPLKDPVFCPDSLDDCTTGATRPIYYYNNDYWNIEWVSNYFRPGYHNTWGWTNGAQNDIFMTAAEAKAYVRPTYTLNATSHYVYPLNTDIALNATATSSSAGSGQPASAAIDGKLGGYLDSGNGTDSEEWSSNGETTGAWLQLTWPHAVTINQVVLYDRPNWEDHCTAGKLTFADGTVVIHGSLDNGGGATPVSVANKTTTTLLWTCTGVSAYTSNIAATSSSVKSTSAVPSTTTSQEVTATVVVYATAKPTTTAAVGSIASALASRLSLAQAKLTSELAARLSSVAAARAKAAAGTKAARSFDGEYEVTPTPAPTATSLCAIPTPTTVDYTTKVCVGRVCTNKATQTVLSATPCATPTQAFQVEMMPDEAGLPFLDNLPFEAGFDVQERDEIEELVAEVMEKEEEVRLAGERRERMMSRGIHGGADF